MTTAPIIGDTRPLSIFVPHASDLLTDYGAHGDGLVAYEIVSRLARAGHEVHAAAPRIALRAEVPPTLRLYELRVPLPSSPLGRIAYMIAVRRLFERLRNAHAIDVVHQLNPVFTGISLALSGTGVPVVLGSFVADWPAGIDPRVGSAAHRVPLAARAKRSIASLQQRQARALLLTTPAARSRIIDAGRDAAKIHILPHGIDPGRYKDTSCSTSTPSIAFVGGIERRKGIFTLLDAFPRVRAAIPGCRLVVAGGGREWDRLVAAVAAMADRDAIVLHGNVSHDDVEPILRECSVFCMPSFGEPFGMALLEAMACGRPVVATDAGGARYLVDDDGGRRVPPGSPGALADALIEVLASPALQQRMGRHNRAQVERVYSWDRVIAGLVEVYRSVAGAPRIA